MDLREKENVKNALNLNTFDEIYQLAANLGGIKYLTSNDYQIMHDSVFINVNILEECKNHSVKKIFFSSSSCIYPFENQFNDTKYRCSEESAIPANPDTYYGWEKFFSEQLYQTYAKNYGITLRIARFFNVYGPGDTLGGDKEKVTIALCRKIFYSNDNSTIEIWGRGKSIQIIHLY